MATRRSTSPARGKYVTNHRVSNADPRGAGPQARVLQALRAAPSRRWTRTTWRGGSRIGWAGPPWTRRVAQELGAAGATVYVTGRSRLGNTTDGLPGTVEQTARLVTEAGGRGIAVVCDHTKDTDVRALAERIHTERGRLDLLVNNVWGGYEEYDPELFQLPVWEQPIWRWDKMFDSGVRAHYTTSRATLPLLLESDRPLLINISAGDRGRFLGDVQYDVAKAAINRLAFALARRHRAEGLIAYTLHPGFTRTERVESAFEGEDVDEDARDQMHAETHSPR